MTTRSDPGSPPVRRDARRNRARLLEAADDLIREQGMDLSFNAVAHRAGLGVGTVYRHFADRDTLLQALFEERLELVLQFITSHLDDDDPVAALRAVILGIGDMQADDRGLWDVLSPGPSHDQRELLTTRLVPLAERLVSRATDTGRVRPGFATTDLPVILWIGGALSAHLRAISPTQWRRYLQLLLDGLLPGQRDPLTPLDEQVPTTDDISTATRTWRAGDSVPGDS